MSKKNTRASAGGVRSPCTGSRASARDRAGSSRGVFFSSRRRHTRLSCDWSSDVCSSDLTGVQTCALPIRSKEHTSELQSHDNLVCRLLLEKKKIKHRYRDAGHADHLAPAPCPHRRRG